MFHFDISLYPRIKWGLFSFSTHVTSIVNRNIVPDMEKLKIPISLLFYSSSSLACVDPVAYWLRELSLVHEAECTIMLQSKPVSPAEQARQQFQQQQQQAGKAKEGHPEGLALWGAGAGGNSKDTIRAIQARAQSISAAFAKLCR